MKISIKIDLGEAMDRLSILLLKSKEKKELKKVIDKLSQAIIEIVGHKKFSKIILSEEFTDLLKTNRHIWGLMEQAKKDNNLAGQIEKSNYQRFLCKQKVQKKFDDGELEEIKI